MLLLLCSWTPVAVPASRAIADWETLATGQRIGASDAVLTIIEFGDYECSACQRFHNLITDLLAEHGEDVAFYYRHWPLPQHRFSFAAAAAAECAGQQGQFWAFHDWLYANQHWSDATFTELAREVGVRDLEQFNACRQDGATRDLINHETEIARSLNSAGTPTLIVNGVLWGGIPTLDELRAIVADAKARGQ